MSVVSAMQNRLFVFAGISKDTATECLSLLYTALNRIFAANELPVKFSMKDKLVTARFDDVSFYISIFPEESEVDDFYEMARNFQLPTKPNPIDNVVFEKRLAKKKVELPTLYTDAHYLVARTIFSEVSKFDLQAVYLFF
jgi:hypothetical protein